MHAVLKGTPTGGAWSDPTAWANGMVPRSSNGLNVLLDATSVEDLGTAQHPFLTNDVIGAAACLTHPALSVSGFLHARDVGNLSELSVNGVFGGDALQAVNVQNVGDVEVRQNGSLYVKHDLADVQNVVAADGGTLKVGHDLANVQHITVSFGSTVDIGHSLGSTSFGMGIAGATLILDNPAHHSLSNMFSIGSGDGAENIELGGVAFDHASFIPNAPGSLIGKIQVTNHGSPVYQLTNVVENNPVGILSVGQDKTTGYDFISYHA